MSHTHCERGGGKKRGRQTGRKEKHRPGGIKTPLSHTHSEADSQEMKTDRQTHTYRETLPGERERVLLGLVASYSSFTVSSSPWRRLAPTPRSGFWLICQAPHPTRAQETGAGEGRSSGGRGREGPMPVPCTPYLCASPQKQLHEMQPCSAAWSKGPGLRGREGARVWAWGRSLAQCAPHGSGQG